MTFEPARPRYTLPFAGKEYTLLGTMETIEAVELALKDGVLQIMARTMAMGATETAKLVSSVVSANGYDTITYRSAFEAIMGMGIHSEGFEALRMHLYAFLRIVIEPPELREEMAKRMGEITGKLHALSASPGDSTSSSA